MTRLSTTQRGFTLLEVMIGLALLGLALAMLIKSVSGTISTTRRSELTGVVTELSRGKMYDIEEKLLKDGFSDTDQSEGECGEPMREVNAAPRPIESDAELIERALKSGKPFEDEGWPLIRYSYKVEEVELPSWEDLQQMAKGRAASGSGGSSGSAGSGAGSGSDGFDGSTSFQNSALGGMLSQMGGGFGGGGGDIDSKQGASFIASQYSMVQQVLKVSIRKVTLCVSYDILGVPEQLKTVAFFTDASAMDKVLSGLGSQDLDDSAGSGSGSGSGKGKGSGSGSGSGGFKGGGGLGSGKTK